MIDRQQSAEDVTTKVIDIEARIKAQAASVDSIRGLLARNTGESIIGRCELVAHACYESLELLHACFGRIELNDAQAASLYLNRS